MLPSFSTQCTQSTQIKPFGNCGSTINNRITHETPQQPRTSSWSSSSMYVTGVNNSAGMIRPM